MPTDHDIATSKSVKPEQRSMPRGRKRPRSDAGVTSLFLNEELERRNIQDQTNELKKKPLRTYSSDCLAWLVANPKYISHRVLQQYVPGLVNAQFRYKQGLLMFHNDYGMQKALEKRTALIDGQHYPIDKFKSSNQLRVLLSKNKTAKQYSHATIDAEVTEISSRALLQRVPGLDIVDWEPDRRGAHSITQSFCGATAKFASAAACKKALEIGLFNIEGENVRVRPYKRWNERNEEIKRDW